ALIAMGVDFVHASRKGGTRFLGFLGLSFILFLISMELSNLLLGAKYPVERKCVVYFPFLALILSLYVDGFMAESFKKWTGILLGILLTFHFMKSTKDGSVWEWWYDANTKKITTILKANEGENAVSVGTHWMFHPTLKYYNHFTYKD